MSKGIDELQSAIDSLLAVDPDQLTDAELHELVTTLQRQRHRMAAAAGAAVSAWDQRMVWADNGAGSAAVRLANETSASPSSTGIEVKRARKLRTMPHVAAAPAGGERSGDVGHGAQLAGPLHLDAGRRRGRGGLVGEADSGGAGAVVGPDHSLVPRRDRSTGGGRHSVALALQRGDQLVEFGVGQLVRVDGEERIDRRLQLVDPLRHDERLAHVYVNPSDRARMFDLICSGVRARTVSRRWPGTRVSGSPGRGVGRRSCTGS